MYNGLRDTLQGEKTGQRNGWPSFIHSAKESVAFDFDHITASIVSAAGANAMRQAFFATVGACD
jgi:hypothetical protein